MSLLDFQNEQKELRGEGEMIQRVVVLILLRIRVKKKNRVSRCCHLAVNILTRGLSTFFFFFFLPGHRRGIRFAVAEGLLLLTDSCARIHTP